MVKPGDDDYDFFSYLAELEELEKPPEWLEKSETCQKELKELFGILVKDAYSNLAPNINRAIRKQYENEQQCLESIRNRDEKFVKVFAFAVQVSDYDYAKNYVSNVLTCYNDSLAAEQEYETVEYHYKWLEDSFDNDNLYLTYTWDSYPGAREADQKKDEAARDKVEKKQRYDDSRLNAKEIKNLEPKNITR